MSRYPNVPISQCPHILISQCPPILLSPYPAVPISRCPVSLSPRLAQPQQQHSCPSSTRLQSWQMWLVAATAPCPSRAGSPRVPMSPSNPLSRSHFHTQKGNTTQWVTEMGWCLSAVGKPAKPRNFGFIPRHYREYLLVTPPGVGQGWWVFGKWIFLGKKHKWRQNLARAACPPGWSHPGRAE